MRRAAETQRKPQAKVKPASSFPSRSPRPRINDSRINDSDSLRLHMYCKSALHMSDMCEPCLSLAGWLSLASHERTALSR